MPLSPRAPKSKKPKRRRPDTTASDDQDEEEEILPPARAFPTFLPTQADIERKKEKAKQEIRDMAKGTGSPVVQFKKPDVKFKRPMWRYDNTVQRDYIPALNLMQERPRPPPTEEDEKHPINPPWINSIRRVIAGCPQMGLPVHYEGTSAKTLRAEQRLTEHKKRVAEEVRSARSTSSHSQKMKHEQLVHSRGIGKPKSKREEYDELLTAPEIVEQIRRQCMTPEGDKDTDKKHRFSKPSPTNEPPRRKSIMISLPKIGVRMFSVSLDADGRPNLPSSRTARDSKTSSTLPEIPNTARF